MRKSRIKLENFLQNWSSDVTIRNEDGMTITGFDAKDVSVEKVIKSNPILVNAFVKKIDLDDSMWADKGGKIIITV